MPESKRVKVRVKLRQDEDGYPPFGSEGLWGVQLLNGNYLIDNIPFFAKGLAAKDEVDVTSERVKGGKILWVKSVVRDGGNSVFRISCDVGSLATIRRELIDLGVHTEVDAKLHLVAAEVARDADIVPILNFLVDGQENGRFDFEEGALRHALPE